MIKKIESKKEDPVVENDSPKKNKGYPGKNT